MKKLFLSILTTLVLLTGCGGIEQDLFSPNPETFVGAGPIVVKVVNQSSWPEASLAIWIRDENRQLQEDFKPVWGIDATIVEATPNAGDLQLIIQDNGDNIPTADGGIHTVNIARVSQERSGQAPGYACSHEVLEMLMDPRNDGREICDAVWTSIYSIIPEDTAMLSDFVYPAWYGDQNPPGVSPTKYDQMGLLIASHTYTDKGFGG